MTISDIAVLLNNVKTSAVLGAVVSLQSYVVSRIFLHILYVLVRPMSASWCISESEEGLIIQIAKNLSNVRRKCLRKQRRKNLCLVRYKFGDGSDWRN